MSKVVYNGCYGGFSLSNAAIELYASLKGITLYQAKKKMFGGNKYFTTEEAAKSGNYEFAFNDRDLDRADPALVQVVEALGGGASGSFANLTIQELEPGCQYRIQEYDGNEWVETPADIEWKVAP